MRPLTLDDLLPLGEYAGRRREFFESMARYLDRYRRVRVGPRLTLIFENRQTLWFRIQELLRIARLADPERVSRELVVYNRLLPARDTLQAALRIHIEDETKLAEELRPWAVLRSADLNLCIGDETVPADLVTCRPEDRAIGTAHWLRFTVRDRRGLADFRVPAIVRVGVTDYQHESPPLSQEIRQSLLEDLEMSDRDRD